MKTFVFRSFILLAILFIVAFKAQTIPDDEKFKQEFLDRINAVRSKGCKCGITYMPPAPPLTWNDQLAQAAAGHALDMFSRNYFSHTSKNGRTAEDRILQAGYTFKGYKSFAAGENIAQGQQQIDEVMDGWIKSEGHCKNLMNPSFREVGVAESHLYWVQDFGGRESFSPDEQKLINSGQIRLLPAKRSSN